MAHDDRRQALEYRRDRVHDKLPPRREHRYRLKYPGERRDQERRVQINHSPAGTLRNTTARKKLPGAIPQQKRLSRCGSTVLTSPSTGRASLADALNRSGDVATLRPAWLMLTGR